MALITKLGTPGHMLLHVRLLSAWRPLINTNLDSVWIFLYFGRFLAFNRTGGDPIDDIALRVQKYDDDRKYNKECPRHDHAPFN